MEKTIVQERRNAVKDIKKAPVEVVKRYDVWAQIVTRSGVNALRNFSGFHDEALKGKLKGMRSSRLGIQWRVIYSVDIDDVVTVVTVERVTPHEYKP